MSTKQKEKDLKVLDSIAAVSESLSSSMDGMVLGTDMLDAGNIASKVVPRMQSQVSSDHLLSTVTCSEALVSNPYCPGELLRRSAYCGSMPPITDLEIASETSTADTAERNAADALPSSSRDTSPTVRRHTVRSSSSPESIGSCMKLQGPPGLWDSTLNSAGISTAQEELETGGPPGFWVGAIDFSTPDSTPISSNNTSPCVRPPGVWDTSVAALSFYAQLAEVDASMYIEPPNVGSQGHQSGECKPCAFVFKEGCTNGASCKFCHLCDPSAKKRRKRERLLARRNAIRIPLFGASK
jgi:hypothetical protein